MWLTSRSAHIAELNRLVTESTGVSSSVYVLTVMRELYTRLSRQYTSWRQTTTTVNTHMYNVHVHAFRQKGRKEWREERDRDRETKREKRVEMEETGCLRYM